ncbi:hypothetical protein [Streptomyces sp. NBC_01669]|nr:hypothetical protein [Streptomyces sp. NBC_01669]MCX4537685.1 hypothetical protein [Streptomyces sp. NBC_01669]
MPPLTPAPQRRRRAAAALDVVATVSVFHPKQFRHRHLFAVIEWIPVA